MLKLHKYNHQGVFNRNHQAPGDSAQNEAETTNASDNTYTIRCPSKRNGFKMGVFQVLWWPAHRWRVDTEVKEREAICMEKNAWEVAKQVIAMVDDEPGPAKDYCLEVLHDDNI